MGSAQSVPVQYKVIDRGPSLVRTLVNTPGLNQNGDLAIWRLANSNASPGVLFHNQQATAILGEKNFSIVYPSDVNNQLVVVGTLQSPQDLRFTHAFKWADNKIEILDTLGGLYAAANAINAAGSVAGNAQTPSGSQHAVVWLAKQARDLGVVAQGDYSSAHDINDKGDIVGEANLIRNGKPRAFLWHAGKMQLLGGLAGATFCSAQAINNGDVVIGFCDRPNGAAHGVLWNKGRIEDLGTLGDDDDATSTALDINSQAQVVGSSEIEDGKQRAFLWQKGKMLDLNNAIPLDSGWRLMVASRINNSGQIAGRGYFKGSIHAFILQPIHASGMRLE